MHYTIYPCSLFVLYIVCTSQTYTPISLLPSSLFLLVTTSMFSTSVSLFLFGYIHLFVSFFFLNFIYFLYSRFLLVIHFIHIIVYMSIAISQFITPPPPHHFPPLVSIRLFSTFVSQLLPCKPRFHL